MSDKLRISGIIKESIVDGPGIRYVVFTQGCLHKCEGCHNPQTHDLEGGYFIDIDDIITEVKKNPLLDGLTFSGGEPFLQPEALSTLGKAAKALGLNIITYTGYTFDQLTELSKSKPDITSLLQVTDILIDGRFELSQKDLLLKFRGSKNQRPIDVPNTLKTGTVVLLDW
jgi:anaerobic ribonucleoside-triphosphate reductase activating protein